jgi:hypothetical protein
MPNPIAKLLTFLFPGKTNRLKPFTVKEFSRYIFSGERFPKSLEFPQEGLNSQNRTKTDALHA